MEPSDSYEVLHYIPAPSLPYSQPGSCYTLVRLPEDDPTVGRNDLLLLFRVPSPCWESVKFKHNENNNLKQMLDVTQKKLAKCDKIISYDYGKGTLFPWSTKYFIYIIYIYKII